MQEAQTIINLGPTLPMMSYQEFAKQMNVSVRTVQRRVEEGALPTIELGKGNRMINVALLWKEALEKPY